MKWLLLYLLLFSCGVQGQGLHPGKALSQYNFSNWDTEKGLPSNAVQEILQSKDGYMWLVTYGGLVRFNSLQFVIFNVANTPQMISNTLSGICQDAEGALWISSGAGGINRLHRGIFSRYTTEQGLPGNIVDDVVVDRQGVLWAATIKGLCYLKNNHFIQEGIPGELKNTKIQRLYADRKGFLWVGTQKGIYKSGGKILEQYQQGNGLGSNVIEVISEDRSGNIWVGTNKGLCRISEGRATFYKLHDGVTERSVTAIYEDRTGNLWLGTFTGLVRFKNNIPEYFPASNPLSRVRIQHITQDSEGNIWVATYRKGIYKISDGIFSNFSRTDMDADDYITHAIAEIDSQTFAIAYDKGVSLLDRRTNQLKELNPGKDRITGLVKSVTVDRKGTLWICTREGLIGYKDGKSRKITVKDGLPDNYTRLVCEDARGNLWIGTHAGLACLSGEKITTYTTADGLCDNVILGITEDSRRRLWVSTRNGVNCLTNYEPSSRRATMVSYHSQTELAGDVSFRVYEDKQGAIWIGSNRGLTYCKDNHFVRITQADGLASDVIFQVFEDRMGNFWMTTDANRMAIFSVPGKDLRDFVAGRTRSFTSRGYGHVEGVKTGESTPNGSGIMAGDGTIWFPTPAGVEMINPAQINTGQYDPQVVIEKFIADDQEFDPSALLEFPAGKSRFEIHYAGLSFTAPQSVQYRYRLEGYDKDWQYVESRHQAFYTNLAPGHYTFLVSASTGNGKWSPKVASVKFYLAPFFYQTRWFMVLMVFSFMMSGTLAYQWRIRRLERDKQRLEKLVASRTGEILRKNEELAHQKEAILLQHNDIEIQKKQIEEAYETIQVKNKHITDSIRYARTIQHATLPNEEHLKEAAGEYFMLYRPKDIVSGDFYWCTTLGTPPETVRRFVAVVDCTGHGVPGAFMSMIGNRLLSEIVSQERITSPDRIFELLDQRIQLALKQKEQSNSDGMDVCLCVFEGIDSLHTKVIFAGAKRPLFYLQPGDAELQCLKGNRNSIGGRNRKGSFESHELILPKGTMCYLATDGFADQNNAAKEKFGHARLTQLLPGVSVLPMYVQQQTLEKVLDEFMAGADQRDDITLMGIRL